MHYDVRDLYKETWAHRDSGDNLDYLRGIFAIKSLLNSKEHHYTFIHSVHVSTYAYLIGCELKLDKKKLKDLILTALLHDIGKAKIPKDILLKKGPLTLQEFEKVKKHAFYGAEIIKKIKPFEYLDHNILCHHERWDGKGYPFGLKNEEIPLFSRIVAIADSFDAMTTDRPYQNRISPGEALKKLQENANKQFDGELVKIFNDLMLKRRGLNNKKTIQVGYK